MENLVQIGRHFQTNEGKEENEEAIQQAQGQGDSNQEEEGLSFLQGEIGEMEIPMEMPRNFMPLILYGPKNNESNLRKANEFILMESEIPDTLRKYGEFAFQEIISFNYDTAMMYLIRSDYIIDVRIDSF